MDVARYGDYATLAYTNAKVQENYRRRFRITFPNEELPGRPAAADDADPRPADRGERGLGRDVRAGARAVVPGGRASSRRRTSRSGARTPGSCVAEEVARRPRAGRDDRDLELRQVPGHRPGRRGVAVVAADGPDAGARPDHADRDAQRRGPDRRRVHGRARRPRPTSSTCSGRCRPRSTTRAGSGTTCRRDGSVAVRGARAGARRAVGRRAAIARRAGGGRAGPRPVDRGVPVHDVPAGRPRDDPGPPRPGSTTPATSATSCGSRPSTSARCSTGSWPRASRTACGCSGCAR